MSQILFRTSDLVKTECRNTMLLGDMSILRLLIHAQQIEGDKHKEITKKKKKARFVNYEYSQQRSSG